MLHPLLRFRIDESGAPQLVQTGRRSWRRRLVVGRESCIFETVPCKGVALHELNSFVSIQARRLAPFVNSGASAVVRNRTVMLWFWDETEVQAALAAAGQAAHSHRRIAETLLIKPSQRQGTVKLVCEQGIDTVVMDGGAVVKSQWEPHPTRRSAAVAEWSSRPWARDLIGGPLDRTGSTASTPSLRRWLALAGFGAAALSAAHAAYWAGSLWGAQERLAEVQRSAQGSVEQLEKLTALRQQQRDDQAWVRHYERLGASLHVDALVQALEPTLAQRSLVVKELDVRNDELRLVIVAAAGELDLPGTLEAFGRIAGVRDVALRETLDAKQATFTMQIGPYRRLPSKPDAAQPT